MSHFLNQRRFFAVNRWLFKFALRGMGFNNWRSLSDSGEAWVVKNVLPKLHLEDPPVFMDVGANSGGYSELLMARYPQATVHAFEPHPKTFVTLGENMKGRVQCHPLALGAEKGGFDLYDRGGDDGGIRASLAREALETVQSKPLTAYSVTVSTVDDFVKEHSISAINFIKIDTEGFEMDVLLGAKVSLAEGRISAIQFEFNDVHFARRQFLADFQAVLPGHRLYRILRDGLVPLDLLSVAEREVFTFQNILAWPLTATPL
jgi:FkbM family methyltransferase